MGLGLCQIMAESKKYASQMEPFLTAHVLPEFQVLLKLIALLLMFTQSVDMSLTLAPSWVRVSIMARKGIAFVMIR